MLKKVSSIFNYLSMLLAKQKELQTYSVLKIIEIKNINSDNVVLTVQVINKSTIFHCNPIEIASSNRLLEKFSKQDMRIIIYYAAIELMKAESRIISHRFESELNQIVCKIKNNRTGSLEEKPLKEIVTRNNINRFNSEDALRIGYLQAMEESIHEHFELLNK